MAGASPNITIFGGARLMDGTGAPPLPDATVVVQGEHIVGAGPAGTVVAPPGDVTLVDARGMTLLPGLIDSHVHLTFSAGPDHDSTLRQAVSESEETLVLRAMGSALRALCAGVTTVRDLGGRGRAVQAVRDAVQAGLVPGPRILAAGVPITTTAGHMYFLGLEADTPDELRKAVRGQVRAGADLIKVCATGGNMTPGTNPCAAQYSSTELSLVVDEAHRLGRRVATHAIGAAGIRHAVVAAVDTIEHCHWLGEAEGELDEDIEAVELMAARGLYAGLALPGVYRALLPPPDAAPVEAQARLADLGQRLAGVRWMLAQGVRFVVSSDAGVRFTRFEEFALSLEVAVRGLGLSPLQAMAAATGSAAAALGLEGELGTVQAGKRADLLLVEGDPLADLGALRRVRAVYRDGRLVVRDGHAVVP